VRCFEIPTFYGICLFHETIKQALKTKIAKFDDFILRYSKFAAYLKLA
jgi:hypothetical protein